MKKIFANTFPNGTVLCQKVSTTLVNNTAKTENITVPDDTLWYVQTFRMKNIDDVARTCIIRIFETATKTYELFVVHYNSINAGSGLMIPNNDDLGAGMGNNLQGILLKAGNTIEFVWAAGGASTGATNANAATITYRQLSLT